MKWFIGVTICTFIWITVADNENARLLASKNILNLYMVENKDLTVEYEIYNVGGRSANSQLILGSKQNENRKFLDYRQGEKNVVNIALDTQLVDSSFAETDFEVVLGSLSVKWQRIGPGNNVSHVVVMRPLKPGYFNFSAAELSYLPSESAVEPQRAYTSAPGEGGVVSFKDYDRKFSSHGLDWAAFAVMTLPSLGIPFLLWRRSKCKYENLKPVKKS